MSLNEAELISTYGKSIYSRGQALYRNGRVEESRHVGVGVYRFTVRSGYNNVYVIVWDRGDGSKGAATVETYCPDKASEVAAIMACYDIEGPQSSAEGIAARLTDSQAYREYLLYGGTDDEVDSMCQSVADDFISELKKSEDPYVVIDSMDISIDRCYANRDYDTVPLARTLVSCARKMTDVISGIKPADISRIICSSERLFSRKWLAASPLTEQQAMMAFVDLSERKSLNSYDLAILSCLSRRIDPEAYAEAVTDDSGYYDMERTALRELRRGHHDIAAAVAKRFSDAGDFDEHLSEAGRIRQSVGLVDDEKVFVDAFMKDPNEKRLLDLVANHGDADIGEIMRTAWIGAERTPQALLFFTRNGSDEEVVRFLSEDTGWEGRYMEEEADSVQLLGEVLMGCGRYLESARLLKAVLEDCLSEKGNEEVAAHIMNMLDSEYEEAAPVLSEYCSGFRERHRSKMLWDCYGSGGHF